MTDADLLAEQMIWAATHEAGHERGRSTSRTATSSAGAGCGRRSPTYFGLEWEGFEGEPRTARSRRWRAWSRVWKDIAARHGLVEPDLDRVASWWHTDGDLGREIEVLTDMNKSRKAGFTAARDTRDSFFSYVERYRAARILP